MEITSIIQVIVALPALITLVRELMKAAQESMGQGTGVEKKKTVLEGIAAVINNADIWAKVQGIFSRLIDVIALFKPKTA
jgi:urease gamma subunit